LVVGVGAAVVGVGLHELYQAYNAAFLEYLKLGEMGKKVRKWTGRWGRLGIAAQGIVFGMVGTFLIRGTGVRSATGSGPWWRVADRSAAKIRIKTAAMTLGM